MSKTHRWLALVLVLSLAVGALAPTAAFAYRGGNSTSPGGEPIEPPMEYGDPDPTPGGSPVQLAYEQFGQVRRVLFDLFRIRLGMPIAAGLGVTEPTRPVNCTVKVGTTR